jgi:hypothetical protein
MNQTTPLAMGHDKPAAGLASIEEMQLVYRLTRSAKLQ